MSTVADDEFRLLMERVRAGCPDAARDVCDRYGGCLRRVVRRRLHHSLRLQYDSIDFMQDVWASFFTAAQKGYAFDTPDQLLAFLAELASRKVADAGRKNLKARKFNIGHVRPLDHHDPDRDLPVRGPTPSQFAMANESWERLLAGQPADRRLLLEMLRQGSDFREIAERTGMHPKLIQRFLLKIAEKRGHR